MQIINFLKAKLKTDGYDEWYFIVWFMAATGARVSELLHIKAEHIGVGYLDLYSKGGKIRRLYIPKTLRTEADKWLKRPRLNIWIYLSKSFWAAYYHSWYSITTQTFCRKIWNEQRSGLPSFIPSSFCQKFSRPFHDLALLADLMGHESIETTRIYLRRTASEQQKIVDKVVNW